MNTSLDEMKQTLKCSVMMVNFTKADGTPRSMRCTLRQDLLPPRTLDEGDSPKEWGSDNVPAYDLDKKAWRSFNINRVSSFEVVG